ncbi:MAG TPA: PAS domain S-box protein, partial [Burkholderiales bacterium]
MSAGADPRQASSRRHAIAAAILAAGILLSLAAWLLALRMAGDTGVPATTGPVTALPWVLLVAGLAGTALLAHLAWRQDPSPAPREIVSAEGDVVWAQAPPGGRLVEMSPSALALYGHPRERFLESPEFWLSLVHPEDRPRVQELLRAREAGQPAEIECRILRADGEVRWIRDRAWLTRDGAGQAQRLDGVTSDVTAERQAEEELLKIRRAVDQSPAALMLTDPAGRIEYVNARFCALTGYTRDEALAASPRLLKSGLNEPGVYEQLWRALAGGETWRGELFNRRKNGELYWEHNVIAPVRDAAGAITHYVAVKEDISGRRHAEQALGESERLFRSALNNVPDMFLIYGADRRIRFVNDRVLGATGFTEQQMIGCRDEELFDPAHTTAYLPTLHHAIESGTAQSVECSLAFRA